MLPKEELNRIDEELIEQYYREDETSEAVEAEA
jgi:V/A-type H+-transporting ATPase subunit B